MWLENIKPPKDGRTPPAGRPAGVSPRSTCSRQGLCTRAAKERVRKLVTTWKATDLSACSAGLVRTDWVWGTFVPFTAEQVVQLRVHVCVWDCQDSDPRGAMCMEESQPLPSSLSPLNKNRPKPSPAVRGKSRLTHASEPALCSGHPPWRSWQLVVSMTPAPVPPRWTSRDSHPRAGRGQRSASRDLCGKMAPGPATKGCPWLLLPSSRAAPGTVLPPVASSSVETRGGRVS